MTYKWSAYHLYGNVGEKFSLNCTGIFWGTENGNGIELYHLQNTSKFSLSLDLKLVIQTNGTENLCRFGKSGKKVIPRKVLLSFRKISTGMNRSI